MIKAFPNFSLFFLSLPRNIKRLIAVTVDIILCVLSVLLAFFLRLGEFEMSSERVLFAVCMSVALALPIFTISGLYKEIFRHSGWPTLLCVARSITLYGFVYAIIFTFVGMISVPRTVGLIQPMLLLFFVGSSRAFACLWLGEQYQHMLHKSHRPKVLIYGAGKSGRQLAAAMSNNTELQVVGFLDDDDKMHGRLLNGLPIHNPKNLKLLAKTVAINTVLLAITNLNRRQRNRILNQITEAKVSVRTLPSVLDLVQGRVTVSDVRELDINDILGREAVRPDQFLLSKTVKQKSVLITGAGGSIGSELCRQIIKLAPERLLLVEQNEFTLYKIHQELVDKGVDSALVPLLGSVQDKKRIAEIIATWKPQTIYHAAAYKHVPLVEHNLSEGLKNNVFGTLYTAREAIKHGAENFVLISTDKAVRPTNMMGASKRLAEIILQALADESASTKFSMVRFGNVLGSSGSVVPKFRQQIKIGGPVTVTHPEITRFFMTIPEAAQLVLQAGALSEGGDVFVLDMGEPVKIIQLARRMIELSGLSVSNETDADGDIAIEITGLRPGEKLYEELLIGNNPEATAHSRIMKAHEEKYFTWDELHVKLNALIAALNSNDVGAVQSIVSELVQEYQQSEQIVDWVYAKKNGIHIKQ